MKLTCDREKFLQAFQTAASVIPARSTKEILQNVRMDIESELGTLMATDLEVGIRVELSGLEISAPGRVLLPAKQFGMMLRESTDETLQLESDGEKLHVRGQRSNYQFPTQDPESYPVVSPFQEEAYHQLPARFFREVIHRTVFATDPESTHYALGGVLLELSETELLAVATDGRRLAKQEGPAESVGGQLTRENTLVPARALQMMDRAVMGNEENVQLAVRENDVLLRSERTTIYSRLVEGRFPRWRDVFPRQTDGATIEMTVGPFLAAVRQAAIVTSEEHRGVDFAFGEGKLVLSGHGAERGDSHVELPVPYDGEVIRVLLDPSYVIDFLRVLEPEAAVTMLIRDPDSPVVGSTDDGYSYAIMPLSVGR